MRVTERGTARRTRRGTTPVTARGTARGTACGTACGMPCGTVRGMVRRVTRGGGGTGAQRPTRQADLPAASHLTRTRHPHIDPSMRRARLQALSHAVEPARELENRQNNLKVCPPLKKQALRPHLYAGAVCTTSCLLLLLKRRRCTCSEKLQHNKNHFTYSAVTRSCRFPFLRQKLACRKYREDFAHLGDC